MEFVLHPFFKENSSKYQQKWRNWATYMQAQTGCTPLWPYNSLNEQYFNLHALVFTQAEEERLKVAYGKIVALLHAIRDALTDNPEYIELLGIPEQLYEACLQVQIPGLTALGRFDWVFTQDGELKVLEFNSETPFGHIETLYEQRLGALEHPGYTNPNRNWGAMLGASLRASFERQGGNRSSVLAIIGEVSLDGCEESITLNALCKVAKYPCKEVLVGDVSELELTSDGRLSMRGKTLDFIHNVGYSVEWFAQDEGGPQFIKALKEGKINLINPPQTLVMHSKALFALAWSLAVIPGILPEEHREPIKEYIPFTQFIPLHRKPMMVKTLHGRQGRGVYYVKSAENYVQPEEEIPVYQQYFDVRQFEIPVVDQDGSVRYQMCTHTIGTFCAGNDEIGGYYTRFGGKVINTQGVYWMPTLIER